jgi:peptidoglycan/LPS O-acetylase OafA/YrhL
VRASQLGEQALVKHNQRFLWLDLIRGLSALAVCAGHLRAVIFQDFGQHAGSWWRPFYFATGLGHQAVMVFFVLSGFFVGGSVLKKGADFQWRDYAMARLIRLWTVLLPALAVTFVVDLVTSAVSPDVIHGQYYAAWTSGPRPGAFSSDWHTWLANVLFLQTVISPVFGTNGPLWSLANEFWYYLIFPFCAVAVGLCGRGRVSRRIAAAVVAAACLAWLPKGFGVGYLVWLLGVGVWFVAVKGFLRKGAAVVACIGTVLFGLSLVASKMPGGLNSWLSADFLIGIAFTVLAAGLVSLSGPRKWPRPIAACVRALSEFSYSLYVVHFPILVLIGATCYRDHQLAPGPMALLQYAGWLAVLMAVAAAFWWAFERRTNEVRLFVTTALAGRFPPIQPVVYAER